MKDIELPPLPDLGSQWTPYWTKVVHKQMQSYARAAVEADRAQRLPDGWKLVPVEPTAEMLDAGRKACNGNMYPQDMLHGPRAMMADRWYAAINAAPSLLASTPAPAQQEPSEAEMVCAEAYQVVGCLLSDLGLFETEAARKILDNLSEARMVHQDVLPWESTTKHQEPPQQERQIAEALRRRGLTLVKTANGYDVLELGHITAQASGPQQERKPMTNAPTEVEKLMDAAGLCRRCAEPTDTRGVKDVLAERQRQIKSEGYSPESDDAYWQNDLVKAAVCYAWPMYPMREGVGEDPHDQRKWAPDLWPWEARHWKPKDRRSNLVRAGALILAEIERLDRVERHHGIKE